MKVLNVWLMQESNHLCLKIYEEPSHGDVLRFQSEINDYTAMKNCKKPLNSFYNFVRWSTSQCYVIRSFSLLVIVFNMRNGKFPHVDFATCFSQMTNRKLLGLVVHALLHY